MSKVILGLWLSPLLIPTIIIAFTLYNYSCLGSAKKSVPIQVSIKHSELENYYDGIHLCRYGYEKVTQKDIKEMKFLLNL